MDNKKGNELSALEKFLYYCIVFLVHVIMTDWFLHTIFDISWMLKLL